MDMQLKVNYWIFSNKPAGSYTTKYDMTWILAQNAYYFKKTEPNRARIQPGDVVYLRIFGDSYIGRCVIGDEWVVDPEYRLQQSPEAGAFPLTNIELWSRPLPQGMVIRDLSNQDVRARIVRISHDDAIMIETAQRIYSRLGFGGADGQIFILEKGLEEAIKPNLAKLGLRLANERICQQFAMGPGVGRSDLICVDGNNDLVVLELKRGATSDETIGQVLRYVGYVMENIAAEGQQVFGAIVASDYDEQLRLAAMGSGVRLYLVRLG